MFSVLLLATGVSLAVPISNPDNRHNLASTSNNIIEAAAPASGGTDQVCIFCHTPHSATPESTLWSRPDPNLSGTFPLYNSPLVIKEDFPGSPLGSKDRSQYKDDGSVIYPNGASRLCLSCHDGATAIGILSDGTSIAMAGGVDFISGTAVIDLSTSHPISFVYDGAVLADINATTKAGTYQLPPPYSISGVDLPLDGNNRMQCTTCHDPHDDASLTGLPAFWRHTSLQNGGLFADAYEETCGQCHIGGTPAGPLGDHNPGPGI